MELWLLRHAAAEDRARSGRDEDRALTPEGLARAEAVGRGLALLEPGIARILSSPYLRARQTAQAAGKALGIAVSESPALEPERDPEEILVEASDSGDPVLLVVGHQPHLGALLGRLVAGPGGDIPMKKASVARVGVHGRWSGTLKAYLPAGVLEKLGGLESRVER